MATQQADKKRKRAAKEEKEGEDASQCSDASREKYEKALSTVVPALPASLSSRCGVPQSGCAKYAGQTLGEVAKVDRVFLVWLTMCWVSEDYEHHRPALRCEPHRKSVTDPQVCKILETRYLYDQQPDLGAGGAGRHKVCLQIRDAQWWDLLEKASLLEQKKMLLTERTNFEELCGCTHGKSEINADFFDRLVVETEWPDLPQAARNICQTMHLCYECTHVMSADSLKTPCKGYKIRFVHKTCWWRILRELEHAAHVCGSPGGPWLPCKHRATDTQKWEMDEFWMLCAAENKEAKEATEETNQN